MKGKLGIQILVGLFAGILTGVFLGEYAEPLGYIGDAFVGGSDDSSFGQLGR